MTIRIKQESEQPPTYLGKDRLSEDEFDLVSAMLGVDFADIDAVIAALEGQAELEDMPGSDDSERFYKLTWPNAITYLLAKDDGGSELAS